jgi:purine catabolism regulator
MILGDVLAHPDFKLELLVSGDDERRRVVLGAHAIETENPSRWVPPQWIVLTTGMRLRRNVAAQRALVAELAGNGVVALGFGTGIAFETVPRAIVQEAERHGLPLFAVPEETPFRDIVRMVDADLVARDLQTLRRSASITDTLVQALGDPDPERALVASLARLLRCEASLHRSDGTVLYSSTSAADTAERWERLRELPLSAPPVQIVADGLFATAVEVDGAVVAWVVLEVSRGSLAVPLILRALTVTGRLLDGLLGVRGRRSGLRRSARGELLDELLRPLAERVRDPHIPDSEDRAAELGVDLATPGVVAVGRTGASPAPVEDLLNRSRVPHLLTCRQGMLVLRLPADVDDGLLAEVGRAAGAEPLGVGRPAGGPDGVRTSYDDAMVAFSCAALSAVPGGDGPAVVRYGDLGLMEWLVLSAGVESVRERVLDVLRPLEGHDHLLDTLRVYLRTSLNVPATARALHVHENSVRHRLNRVRTLLGFDLHSAPRLAEIYVALMLRDAVPAVVPGETAGAA